MLQATSTCADAWRYGMQRRGVVLLLQQRLRCLHKLTSDVRLQQQFLVATLWVLCPEWGPDGLYMPEVHPAFQNASWLPVIGVLQETAEASC